jgi:hypothetical protein
MRLVALISKEINNERRSSRDVHVLFNRSTNDRSWTERADLRETMIGS